MTGLIVLAVALIVVAVLRTATKQPAGNASASMTRMQYGMQRVKQFTAPPQMPTASQPSSSGPPLYGQPVPPNPSYAGQPLPGPQGWQQPGPPPGGWQQPVGQAAWQPSAGAGGWQPSAGAGGWQQPFATPGGWPRPFPMPGGWQQPAGPVPGRWQHAGGSPPRQPMSRQDVDARVRELMADRNEVAAVRLLCDEADLGIIEAQRYARELANPDRTNPDRTNPDRANADRANADRADADAAGRPQSTSSGGATDARTTEPRDIGSAAFAESVFETRSDADEWASGWTDDYQLDRTDIDELWKTVSQGRPSALQPAAGSRPSGGGTDDSAFDVGRDDYGRDFDD